MLPRPATTSLVCWGPPHPRVRGLYGNQLFWPRSVAQGGLQGERGARGPTVLLPRLLRHRENRLSVHICICSSLRSDSPRTSCSTSSAVATTPRRSTICSTRSCRSFSFHDAPSHHGEVSPGPLVLDRLLVPERNLQEYGVLCAVHPLGYHSIGFEQKTLAYGALYSAWYLKESTPVPEMMLKDCHISLGSFYEITSILRNQESLSVVDAAYIYSLAQENSYYTKQSLQLEEKSSKSSPNNILACAEDL